MLHHFSHVIEYWILLGLSIFFSHSISKSFHADECTFLSEEKASTSFFIARISPWWTTDVLLAKECREHFTQIMIWYHNRWYQCNVLWYCSAIIHVSDALRYGYVVAVFSKKQKTGTKNLWPFRFSTSMSKSLKLLPSFLGLLEKPNGQRPNDLENWKKKNMDPRQNKASCKIRLENCLFF